MARMGTNENLIRFALISAIGGHSLLPPSFPRSAWERTSLSAPRSATIWLDKLNSPGLSAAPERGEHAEAPEKFRDVVGDPARQCYDCPPMARMDTNENLN